MSDIVVTVPKGIWLDWICEGDPAGQAEASGEEWGFFLGAAQGIPDIHPGERVYVVAHGRLRGYAPLTRLQRYPLALGRKGGAVAVTIDAPIVGFRGWRYRDWERSAECPFPDWRTGGVPEPGPRADEHYRWHRLRQLDVAERGPLLPLGPGGPLFGGV